MPTEKEPWPLDDLLTAVEVGQLDDEKMWALDDLFDADSNARVRIVRVIDDHVTANRRALERTLSDPPFTERTLRNRRLLILTSSIALAMRFLSLVPTEIQALGLSFAPDQQNTLVVASVIIMGYFFLSFWSVARLEIVAWSARIWDAKRKVEKDQKLTRHFLRRFGVPDSTWTPLEESLHKQPVKLADEEFRALELASKRALKQAKGNKPIDYYFPLLLGFGTAVAVLAA